MGSPAQSENIMTKENKQAEDVASVLAGKIKCPQCGGTGESWYLNSKTDPNPEKEYGECFMCKGRRWMTEEEHAGWMEIYVDRDSV
jgi:DNA-directed RNA polymerase subunit M/transcription elongation factor TFIIS